MSVSSIPDKIKYALWAQSAGRCQYDGCNKPLWFDLLTKARFSTAYVAHIIADVPGGPRGDAKLSEKLKDDISNLMLMCDAHHRLIDKDKVAEHSVELLRNMKERHEHRIDMQSSITQEKQSHILMYGANVGNHSINVNWEKASLAMAPDWYPADNNGIELSLKNSVIKDHDDVFWTVERKQLQQHFKTLVASRLALGDIGHISIFAMAPQPLLIEMGRLLSDIPAAEVYQLHREPQTWKWQDDPVGFEYIVNEPEASVKKVAINLSLSADIDNSRITSIIGNDIAIWQVTVPEPGNDYLRGREQLTKFRQCFRKLLNDIKLKHGKDAEVHLFPAAPVSVSIEIGRVWMPKADLPIKIYEQNSKLGGFNYAFEIINN